MYNVVTISKYRLFLPRNSRKLVNAHLSIDTLLLKSEGSKIGTSRQVAFLLPGTNFWKR